MSNTNKSNIQYFEAPTMADLYERLQKWQDENEKRLLSTSIQIDGTKFCCIALTNPSEVVITNCGGTEYVGVNCGRLCVWTADV